MSLCYDQNLPDLVTYNAFMYFKFHRVNNILVRESERKFGALPTKLRQLPGKQKVLTYVQITWKKKKRDKCKKHFLSTGFVWSSLRHTVR